MRIIALFALFAASAFAQTQSPSLPARCGPEQASLDVKLDQSPHAVAQPEPGKALIYFIQDIGEQHFGIGVAAVTWVALDGAWVGGNKNSSYFSVSVEAGEHHVCSVLRSELLGHPTEFTHFTAEAGKAYYFRARYTTGFLFIDAADSDEAKYLIATYPQTISKLKK